jgi:hypothetical protein
VHRNTDLAGQAGRRLIYSAGSTMTIMLGKVEA